MFAGTSAGSIILTALAMPQKDNPKEPEFWAEDVANLFANNVDVFFKKNDKPGTGVYVIWISISIIVFGMIFNFWCRSKY
jgi:hypothetical protein